MKDCIVKFLNIIKEYFLIFLDYLIDFIKANSKSLIIAFIIFLIIYVFIDE